MRPVIPRPSRLLITTAYGCSVTVLCAGILDSRIENPASATSKDFPGNSGKEACRIGAPSSGYVQILKYLGLGILIVFAAQLWYLFVSYVGLSMPAVLLAFSEIYSLLHGDVIALFRSE